MSNFKLQIANPLCLLSQGGKSLSLLYERRLGPSTVSSGIRHAHALSLSKSRIGGFLKLNQGQALITLLFFVIISITITSAAVVLILVNSLSQTKLQESSLAYEAAESGIEEAQLRLLRDPNYSGEPAFTIGSGTVTITKTGSNPYIFLSTGQVGTLIRKIQVTLQYQSGSYHVSSQQEVF